MTATTDRCPGCHGSGIEMSGVTYAGHSEYVGCHDCGPGCPSDCGCRVDDEPEHPESVAQDGLGADSQLCRLLADKAALLGDVDRLTAERDRARGTAVALEAENARLREGIERLCSDIDNPLRERHDESPHDLPEVAEDLRALLADTDSAQAEGGE